MIEKSKNDNKKEEKLINKPSLDMELVTVITQ